MRFEPKTDAEIRAEGLLPEGEYDFEVMSAEDRVSKAGNEMLALQLRVFAPDGGTRTVRDWIVGNQHRKLRGFCEAAGLLDEYDAGTLEAEDLAGRPGRVKIVQREAGEFPASNGVAYYIRPAEPAAAVSKRSYGAPPRAKVGADMDDDIPFGPEWR